MREEIKNETLATKKLSAQMLDDMRLEVQHEIDTAAAAEEKAIGRLAALKGEVESLRIRSAGIRESKDNRQSELLELRGRVGGLRKELKEVEGLLVDTGRSLEQKSEAKREEATAMLRVWEDKVEQARVHLESTKERLQKEKKDVKAACEAEKVRINDKIEAVLGKKDSVVAELKRQLGEFKRRNAQLQEELDANRIRRLEG